MSKGQGLPHATVIYFLLAMKLAEKQARFYPHHPLYLLYVSM